MFSCIHKEGNTRMTLHTSKASESNLIVANDTEILMFLIYGYFTCAISKEQVLEYGTNNYANKGAICKYLTLCKIT